MEGKIKNITAYNKHCVGCQKSERDIMITFQTEINSEFYDLFLTEEQTKDLIEVLNQKLKENQ